MGNAEYMGILMCLSLLCTGFELWLKV